MNRTSNRSHDSNRILPGGGAGCLFGRVSCNLDCVHFLLSRTRAAPEINSMFDRLALVVVLRLEVNFQETLRSPDRMFAVPAAARIQARRFRLKPNSAQSRFEISSFCERQGASRRFVASRVPAASALPLTGLSSIGLMPELQTTSIPRFYCTNCVNAIRVHIGFRLYRCFLASIFRKKQRTGETNHSPTGRFHWTNCWLSSDVC